MNSFDWPDWLVPPVHLQMQLRVPSPLSSFLSSLVVLVVLAVLYVIGARLLRRDPERKGFFARLIGFLHRLDEYLVKVGKWIVAPDGQLYGFAD